MARKTRERILKIIQTRQKEYKSNDTRSHQLQLVRKGNNIWRRTNCPWYPMPRDSAAAATTAAISLAMLNSLTLEMMKIILWLACYGKQVNNTDSLFFAAFGRRCCFVVVVEEEGRNHSTTACDERPKNMREQWGAKEKLARREHTSESTVKVFWILQQRRPNKTPNLVLSHDSVKKFQTKQSKNYDLLRLEDASTSLVPMKSILDTMVGL